MEIDCESMITLPHHHMNFDIYIHTLSQVFHQALNVSSGGSLILGLSHNVIFLKHKKVEKLEILLIFSLTEFSFYIILLNLLSVLHMISVNCI